jgi:hypothetical protein
MKEDPTFIFQRDFISARKDDAVNPPQHENGNPNIVWIILSGLILVDYITYSNETNRTTNAKRGVELSGYMWWTAT